MAGVREDLLSLLSDEVLLLILNKLTHSDLNSLAKAYPRLGILCQDDSKNTPVDLPM